MNESLREAKIQHGKDLNTTKMLWWRNFAIGALISGPLFVFPLSRVLTRRLSGVPQYYV
jgi:hypothetical protein